MLRLKPNLIKAESLVTEPRRYGAEPLDLLGSETGMPERRQDGGRGGRLNDGLTSRPAANFLGNGPLGQAVGKYQVNGPS